MRGWLLGEYNGSFLLLAEWETNRHKEGCMVGVRKGSAGGEGGSAGIDLVGERGNQVRGRNVGSGGRTLGSVAFDGSLQHESSSYYRRDQKWLLLGSVLWPTIWHTVIRPTDFLYKYCRATMRKLNLHFIVE